MFHIDMLRRLTLMIGWEGKKNKLHDCKEAEYLSDRKIYICFFISDKENNAY